MPAPLWLALLALLLLARLPYLPRLGNAYDLGAYLEWTAAIQQHGLAQVFERSSADYVGYQYVLWAIGEGFGRDAGATTVRDKELRIWLKLPGLIGDLLSTVAVIGLAHRLATGAGARLQSGAARRLAGAAGLTDAGALALLAGFLWALHPALIYAGVYWGQNDSLVTAFALAAVWAGLDRRPMLAAVLLATGAMLKPQPLIIVPVLAWVIVTRCGWGGMVRAAVSGTAVLVAGHLYFVLTGNWSAIVAIYRNAVLTTEQLSYSAYNLWWPLQRTVHPAATDTAFRLGSVALPWGMLASWLVLGVLAATATGLLRRRDDAGVLLAAAYFIVGYFTVGAGIHERYNLPAIAFLLPALPLAGRWALPVLILSVTVTVNAAMGAPLDRLYRQGEPVWLSMVVAAANVALFLWMTWLIAGPRAPSPPDQSQPTGDGARSL